MDWAASQWDVEGLVRPPTEKLSWCGSNIVLGGPGIFEKQGSLTRTYEDLVSHNIIYFDIGVKMLRYWMNNNQMLTMKVDGSTLKTFAIEHVGESDETNACSGNNVDLDTRLVGHFYHSASSVTISLVWDLSYASYATFSIKDVSLTLRFTSQSPRKNPNNVLLTLTDTLVTVFSPKSSDNGKTNCTTGHYSDGLYCMRCNSACQDCFGPSSSQCYQCKWGYGFDGVQCVKCAANCGICSGGNSNQCQLCNPGYTLDFDGTCNAGETCKTSPYVIKKNSEIGEPTGYVSICGDVCPAGSFMLWNYTCSSLCNAPLIQRREDGILWCDYPCGVNQFITGDGLCYSRCPDGYSTRMEGSYGFCDLIFTNSSQGCEESYLYKYQNGSCLGDCPYPYVAEFHDERSFCNLPCAEGYFNPWSRDCVETCEPEYARVDDNILYCDGQNSTTNSTDGCESIFDFKYPNGSCLPTCTFPYRDEWHVNSYFCYAPCPGRYYDGVREVCIDSCQPAYVRFENDILYCDVKPDSNNGTNQTNTTTGGCPNIYDFKYPNGSCLSSCPYPHRDEWHDGSYFCYPPCPGRYFDAVREGCVNSCEAEYIRFEDGILYCDGKSDSNNGTNSTNSTTGCPNIYDFKYPNGSCLSSCPFPRRDEWRNGSYFCNSPCPLGYFNPLNQVCVRTCEAEYIRFEDDILYCDGKADSNNGTNSTNSTTGCPSIYDFKYPNGSCLSSCPYPHRDEWHDGSYFCYPPCPGRYYDSVREACVNSCEPEYIRFEDDILYCDGHNNGTNSTNSTTGCPNIFDFKYPNGSCLSSCPYPRRDEWHDGAYFCYPPCPRGYFDTLNQVCIRACEAEYIRFDDDILYCDGKSDSNNGTNQTNTTTGCPSVWEFKYPNGSCLSSCPYPHRDEWHNGSYFCYPPCPGRYYDNMREACVNSCEPEFIRFGDDILYCDGSNNSTNSTNSTTGCPSIYDFKYPNGSCLSNCPYPHRDEWHDGSYFCYPPCPNRYFDAVREVCVNSCEPEYIRFEDYILYCDGQNNSTNSTNSTTGCPNIFDFKYPNGSCLPDCPYPRRDEWHNGSSFCYPPCPLGYFETEKDACVNSCQPEYVRFEDDILYCDGHSDPNNSTNSTTGGCPNIFDFKYPNGSCLPSCPYPRRDEWQNGSYFCYPPCSHGYWSVLTEACVGSCEPEEIRFDDDILYCDGESGSSNGTNSTNSTTGCPNLYDFRYPNGSCLPTCPFPYRDEWHNGSYFCYPPCPNQYFDILKEICISSCEPEYIQFDQDILFCTGHSNATNPNNGTNSTNSTTGCPNIFDFKYPNGSCLSSCPYPRRDEWHDGSYFCYPPCPRGYFDTLNQVCLRHCDPEYIRFEDDILFCDGQNNSTNSTNLTTGCPSIYDFKYPNGSCLSSCPYPHRDEWHDGSYFCYPPCPGRYYDTLEDVCVNTCGPEYIRFDDDIIYCDGYNNGTNSTNSTTGCPNIFDFKYPNGSCLPSCPYPHRDEWHDGSSFCYPPCPRGYFDSLNQVCVRHCDPEYIRFEDDILYCDGHNNGTNSTSSTTGCPSIFDFKYPNGSCLSSCPYPHRDEWHDGAYFCYPPCPGRYYDSVREACVDSCEPEYIRFDDDILYCDGSNNGTNNTNSTTGCPDKNDFKYPNGSCLPSCPYPHREEWHDGSSFCYPPCSRGYWSSLIEVCVGSCEPEYIRFEDDILYCDGVSGSNNGTNSTNSTTGCPNIFDFKYPNGSCLPSCPYPRRDEWYNGSYFCYPPCPLGYFDTLNQVCVRHCDPEYIRFEDDILFCDGKSDSNNGTNSTNSTTGCPSIFDFKYPNGSCLSSCPYPQRDEWHNGSYFCFPPCPGRYYDTLEDVCVNSCEPEYIRFADDIIYCDGHSDNGTNSTNSTTGCPSVWEFKYPNGSCLPSCPYPHREEWRDESYFCYPPCPRGYWSSLNEVCVGSCEPEYIRFEDDILYCDGSNNGTNSTNSTTGCPSIYDFKYPNGSCLPGCPYPRRDEWHNGSYFCYPPCPLGYFDTERASCMNSCQPEYVRFEDDILYCDGSNNSTNSSNSTTGCPSIYDFKYPNGSCLPSCPYPHRDEWHDGSYFCYPPCPLGYFETEAESCVSSCQPEYVRFEDDILYCDGHSDPNNGTNSTNSTAGCPSIYDFKYPNGSCLPSCPYPHRDEWHNGSYFCYPPCPLGYFDIEKDSCMNSCQPEYIRIEDDIVYCDGYSDPNNNTNSTNSTTGCPSIYDFKYPNGSCLVSCPYPRRDEWHNGSYFCYPPCPLGYFDTERDSCVNSCNPEYVRFEVDILYCDGHSDPNNGTNSTNSTIGCPSLYEFKYPNGSCLPRCPYPYRDEWRNGSYFCYPPCPLGYFDILKEACVDSCEPEFIRFVDDILYCEGQSGANNGTNSTNSTAGCPSIYDFKYPNGSCLPSCPYPHRDEWHNGSYFCYPPCPGKYYDTLEDVCVNSCEPEFILFEEDILYCTGHSDPNNGTNSTNSTTGCPNIFDFKYPNGSCLPNCPYPRRDEWHDGSYFCYPPCPLGYFDIEKDSCVNSCQPEYVRFEDDILYCDGHSDPNNGANSTNSTTGCPNVYDFKYPNGSCLSSCPYPHRDEWHNGSYFCYPPCPTKYFDILNERCVDSCEPEFVRFEDDILYCEGQSNNNNRTNSTNSTTGCPNIYDFKYPNGSCISSCPYPRRDEWRDGSYFCLPPCPLGYFDTLNQVCVRTCEAEYIRFEDDILYCDGSNNGTNSTNSTTGCPNIFDFKYPNGSCLSSCPYPHRDEWHNGSYFCYPPCPGRYYDFLRESCVNSCEPEYIRFDDDILYCDGHSDPNNGTNSTNSTTGCPSVWDFKYPNGSCLSSCPYPRRDEWSNGSYFCYPPCPNRYFDAVKEVCVDSCEPEYVRFEDDILYCEGHSDPNNGTNSTNSTAGCPSIYDFKYPNGSCLSSCPYPRRDEWSNGSYFCYPPCSQGYFNTLNQACIDACEPEYVRFEDDILYCDGHSDPNNGTNSTNSTAGCPSVWEFKYPNGSCLSSCPYPHRDEWHDGSYFCYPPCPHRYFDTLTETCIETCEPEYVRFNDILYCDGHSDPNNGTNSTNSTTGCPNIYDFKYPNGSCLSSCPYPRKEEWDNGSYLCNLPCSSGYFDTLSGSCVANCEPEYIRLEDDILYCDGHSDPNNGTNSTNSTAGCPSVWDFKYPNGSCLSSCPYPHRDEWRDGSYFCNPPCSHGYFSVLSESCVDSCEPEYIRFEEDILYCEDQSNSTNPNNGTNSTNSCPWKYDFRYFNGSCLSSCPEPFNATLTQEGYFCDAPCTSGYYFHTLEKRCVDTCQPDSIWVEGDILYCDDQATNEDCPAGSGFKYVNDSCMPSCDYPYRDEYYEGVNLCHPPCQNRYFDAVNMVCLDTCESQNVRIVYDIHYCDPESDSNNGTNSTNSTTGCPNIYDFKYENGSCLSTCPYPYKEELQDGSYFCNAPCPNGYFDTSSEACVDSCEPESIQFEEGIAICETSSSNSSDCTIDYAADGSATTDCTSPSGYCPTGSFLFEDYSCNVTCPAEFTPSLNASCTFPCGLDGALYPDGSCSSGCSTGYTVEMIGNFQLCVEDTTETNPPTNSTESYTVTIEIYIRYDITLTDFNSLNYLIKFINLLANLLGVDPSQIIIISITEGSTIIQSKVELTSDSSDTESIATNKAKAQTMNEKLEAAAESKDLDLDGIAVLNSKFSVITPDDDSDSSTDSKKSSALSSSSSKIVVLIVIIAIAAVALAIIAFAVYRFKLKRKSMQVVDLKRAKEYSVEGNAEIQEKKRDEEIGILDDNSRIHDMKLPTVPAHLEQDQEVARQRAKALAQEKLKQMRRKAQGLDEEVKNGKPVSLNEIMEGIDE